jgi:hypothetical protein
MKTPIPEISRDLFDPDRILQFMTGARQDQPVKNRRLFIAGRNAATTRLDTEVPLLMTGLPCLSLPTIQHCWPWPDY